MFYSLRDVGAADLVTTIGTAARTEARAAAQRLAAIGELVARQARGDATYGRWSCDNWDAVAAQVAAALNLSHATASGQMYLAVALRNRLPKVGSLLAQGVIDVRLAGAITWHTTLITDPTALALVDAALAADAHCYGPLSAPKTTASIDAIVERHDPAAVRRHRVGARGRDVVINAAEQNSGTADFWGSLLAHDAALLDKRLNTMARDICPEDPRTMPQRRADALGALAAGSGQLSCSCGSAHCPTAGPDQRAASIVVHVLAHPDSLNSAADGETDGADGPTALDRDPTLDEWTTGAHREPEPSGPRLPAAQIIDGRGLAVPAPALSALIARGATVATLPLAHDWPTESRYRPSARLRHFIRCRDLTCRFPGCDHPASGCDIDHTVPYPAGPTAVGNLKLLCRKHHLLKTFWGGSHGWRDHQDGDGTVSWISPTGHTYTTRPGSRLLFPTLSLPGASISIEPAPEDNQWRTVMMPIRRTTREQDRAACITAERALNSAVHQANPPPS